MAAGFVDTQASTHPLAAEFVETSGNTDIIAGGWLFNRSDRRRKVSEARPPGDYMAAETSLPP